MTEKVEILNKKEKKRKKKKKNRKNRNAHVDRKSPKKKEKYMG